MAEQSPDNGSITVLSRQVIGYFLEQQQQNPQYIPRLAQQLWDELPPEGRHRLNFIYASVYPNDTDIRQRAIQADLLVEFVQAQIDETIALEKAYAENT